MCGCGGRGVGGADDRTGGGLVGDPRVHAQYRPGARVLGALRSRTVVWDRNFEWAHFAPVCLGTSVWHGGLFGKCDGRPWWGTVYVPGR